MFKLKIENMLADTDNVVYSRYGVSQSHDDNDELLYIKKYDKEKWKNEKIYEFITLNELQEFMETFNIGTIKEYNVKSRTWTRKQIYLETYKDESEDNLIVFKISTSGK